MFSIILINICLKIKDGDPSSMVPADCTTTDGTKTFVLKKMKNRYPSSLQMYHHSFEISSFFFICNKDFIILAFGLSNSLNNLTENKIQIIVSLLVQKIQDM